ncbi:MAG: nonstructural protein [Microviridae sp.]|nr:MAG: nonstructural protein [Microviridae sp.]
MILHVYSIFDMKASYFSAPFFMAHDALAMRAASDLAQDTSSAPGRHPADFALMKLGSFDDQTATFELGQPQNLAVLTAFLQPKQGSLV